MQARKQTTRGDVKYVKTAQYTSLRAIAKQSKNFFSPFTFNFSSNFGFSLAEVLITLLVIGVVSAITIPILMNNIQKAQFKTAYKKAFSVASQAWQQAYTDNLIEKRPGGWCDNTANTANFNTLKSYFNVSKDCGSGNAVTLGCFAAGGDTFYDTPNARNIYSFIDNSGVNWGSSGHICGAIIIDVNGFNKPNTFGKDRYVIAMDNALGANAIDIKKLVPWFDKPNVDANDCLGGSCYYTRDLYN